MSRYADHRQLLGQLVRFAIVGAMNTGVGLVAVYINIFVFGMSTILGNLVGYVFGLLFGFSFHRNWTFRATSGLGIGLFKYLFAFAIAYGVNLACVLGLHRMGVGQALAQAGGVLPYAVTFFVLSRYVVFPEAKTQ